MKRMNSAGDELLYSTGDNPPVSTGYNSPNSTGDGLLDSAGDNSPSFTGYNLPVLVIDKLCLG